MDEFVQVIGNKESSKNRLKITSDDIQESRNEIKKWDSLPSTGIGKALWLVTNIIITETSNCCCHSAGGMLSPSCPVWIRADMCVLEPDEINGTLEADVSSDNVFAGDNIDSATSSVSEKSIWPNHEAHPAQIDIEIYVPKNKYEHKRRTTNIR